MEFEDSVLNNLNILYVEDEELAREEVAEFLEFEVKEVKVASNGEEGLEMFQEFHPDIVITDINMPKMNGLEMAKKIKKISPTTPIIVTSAYSDSDYIIKAIEIGINKYVLKPIDVDELLAMIVQTAKEILFDKAVETQNEYIQFLIDTNPTFMLILTKKEMSKINKTFLEFLGYKDEKEFLKEQEKLNDIIYPSLSALIENLKNTKKGQYFFINKNGKKEKFLVQYKEFPKLDKHIFFFSKVSKEDEYKDILREIISLCTQKEHKNILERILNICDDENIKEEIKRIFNERA